MDRLDIPQTEEEFRARMAALKAKADALAAIPARTLRPMNPADGDADCHACSGSGWAQVLIEGVLRFRRCTCVVSQESAEGVPYEFHGLTLDTYDERDGQRVAVQKAMDFACVESGRDLYLTGGVGAGKTRLAAALANTVHRKRQTVQFARVPLLLHQLQPGRDNADLEERLMTVAVLVLDDLGAERDQATDYTRRTLLMLYEARHDAKLRTVFTSNKSIQEIADMQDDDRLASRIAGRADVVRLTTPDQRVVRRGK